MSIDTVRTTMPDPTAIRLLIDYKSAARSPSEGMAENQHATQLACYALLYRSATGERETGFELHHLIKTKVPKVIISTYGPMAQVLEQLARSSHWLGLIIGDVFGLVTGLPPVVISLGVLYLGFIVYRRIRRKRLPQRGYPQDEYYQ